LTESAGRVAYQQRKNHKDNEKRNQGKSEGDVVQNGKKPYNQRKKAKSQ